MKRCVVFALLIACILSFSACATTSGRLPLTDFYALSKFLDQENFVPELGQDDFREQMKKYSYNGRDLNSFAGTFFDGPSGGGYGTTSDAFGFQNNYTVTDNGKYAEYTNSLYTSVPLAGLKMPKGISFDDDLSAVCKRLGIHFDPSSEFVPDKDNEDVMTLRKDGIVTLELHRLSDKYRLVYTETYESTRSDGRPVTVTRCVFMNFSGENIQLSRFGMFVKEKMPVD